ncbi:MAG: TonB-dependent receptor plug domain-containing protein [Steroidobacteraceae bacterium]
MTSCVPARRAGAATCISALIVLAASPVRAEDSEQPQPVIVTATRVPTPPLEVASSVTVVTADDIEARQERTFADLLKDVPGLNVVQTGGPGGTTSVFMRGTNSNHTKVLIDGIDISDPSNSTGAFDFGQLLTPDIERVEVLRGPQSGLYGSDAIGGVINIVTRKGSGPLQFTGAAEGGSLSTFNQAASISGSQDAFSYAGNLMHYHAGALPVTPLDLLPPGEARNDDYDDNFTVSTKLGLDVTRDFTLGLGARYTSIELRTTGDTFDFITFTSFPAAEQTRARTAEYYARLFAQLSSFDGAFEQTLGFAFSHQRTSTLQPDTPEALNTGERNKVDWQGNLKLQPTETLVLGAEYEHDEISEPISASTRVTSGYAELQSQLGEQWFSALNVRYDDNDRFGSRLTYRFAPAWVINSTGTKLKASVGSGFKAPTLSELFQDFPPLFFANPHLKPETSTGYDAGFEQAAGKTLRFGVTWYYNRIRDLITTDPVTGTTYANVGRATTDGIESFASWQPLKALTLRADYTYTEATDDTTHAELLRRPRHKGNFDANWQVTDAWQVNADVLWIGTWEDGNRDFSIVPLDAPGYTTVNLATRCQINRSFEVFGRLDNLFDRRYQNPTGFLAPGFGVFAGVKVKL